MLALVPTPKEGASAKVRLGLRLRNEATVSGRCACGARQETYEILNDGSLRQVAAVVPASARIYYTRFLHEHDCPAASPELERAVGRGEIRDPAGDLLGGLAS